MTHIHGKPNGQLPYTEMLLDSLCSAYRGSLRLLVFCSLPITCLSSIYRMKKMHAALHKHLHLRKTDDEPAYDENLSELRGTVLLRKKGIVDLNDQIAHIGDKIDELKGDKVTFQLVSASALLGRDPYLSTKMELQNWDAKHDTLAADPGTRYSITFYVDESFGEPGALLVNNHHHHEFYLESVTLGDFGNSSKHIHFLCNSWIYNAKNYDGPRVFFTNKACLPSHTPLGLKSLRETELKKLQGDGTGERKQVDRIYDYDVYNDLGFPDKGAENARPTLGGSKEFPYPRRCRTGRKHNKSDWRTETPSHFLELVYVPRDEIFDYTKTADFVASSIKALTHLLLPGITSLSKGTHQFETLKDVDDLYARGSDLSTCRMQDDDEEDQRPAFEIVSQITTNRSAGDTCLLKFPLPLVVQRSKDAWSTDEEFGRQTLGGMHPFTIERMTAFPPRSSLDPQAYGPSISSIRAQHIEPYLQGMTADEALKQNKLYTLDYVDAFLPYIDRINALEGSKAYASRSIFFLTKKGTLMPVAIELSLPAASGRVDQVFVPPVTNQEDEKWLWKLAKTHAMLNDTAVHQLVSHFVRTHASIEPFIIASHRQLSSMHPLMVLLLPHFKNTLNINAIARKILINASTSNVLHGGLVERTFTAGKYAMELSSTLYKSWRFDKEGLPSDLIKRGMAEQDPNAKHGLRLFIEDYPYAVDGLEVWAAIQTWVRDYVRVYYKTDEDVKEDVEVQRWWQEVREKGHGDKKDEPWWPSMHSIDSLILASTTIIWLASAHHAAVNFGQYPFAGYMPYRPTMGRRLIPSRGTPEYVTFLENPEGFFLSCVGSPSQTTIGLAIIELLSTHASNEEYLGQRSPAHWTDNMEVLQAFERFKEALLAIEENIKERNSNKMLTNRYGEVQVPYTLLFPSSKEGITNRGIPNSTSV